MLSLIGSALLLMASQPAEVLGTVQFGDQAVAIVPPATPATRYSGPFAGGSGLYALNESGNLVSYDKVDLGAWLRRTYPSTNTPELHAKATRIHLLVRAYTRQNDLAIADRIRSTRFSLDSAQVEDIKSNLALFAGYIQAKSGGSINLSYDLVLDDSPQREVQMGTSPFDSIRNRVAAASARTVDFEDAAGKILPAHQGVIQIWPDRVPNPVTQSWVPIANVSYLNSGKSPDRSWSFFDDLSRGLRDILLSRQRQLGYSAAVSPYRSSEAFWKNWMAIPNFNSSDYRSRTPDSYFQSDWAAVSADPLRVILAEAGEGSDRSTLVLDSPKGEIWIDAQDAAELAPMLPSQIAPKLMGSVASSTSGYFKFKINQNQNLGTILTDMHFKSLPETKILPGWDTLVKSGVNGLEFYTDGSLPVGSVTVARQGTLTVARAPEFDEDFTLELFDGAWKAATRSEGGIWTCAEVGEVSSARINLGMGHHKPLDVQIASTAPELVASSSGSFLGTLNTEGSVNQLIVKVNAGRPQGELPITKPMFVNLVHPVVEFDLKDYTGLPLQVVAQGRGSSVFLNYGDLISNDDSSWSVPKGSTDEVQHVVALVRGSGPITQLSLRLGRQDEVTDSYLVGDRTLTISNLRFREATELESLKENVDPDAEWLPMLSTPTVESVATAINSNQYRARLYGLTAAASLQDASLVPLVAVFTRNLDFATSYLALRALLALNKEEGQKALSYALELGPFDHNREAAALLVDASNRSRVVRELVSTITSPEPAVRLRAALQLTAAEGEDATIAKLVMLQDPQPAIREAISQLIDAKNELASRRLLYAAVNDPSERVRSAAYARLLGSSIPDHREQALRGAKDESPVVRLALMQAFAAGPNADERPYIELALKDAQPDVRAAAVLALIKQPGEVTEKDVESLVRDLYPPIHSAMQELARVRHLSFAWDRS